MRGTLSGLILSFKYYPRVVRFAPNPGLKLANAFGVLQDLLVLDLLLAFFKEYISIPTNEFVVRLEVWILLNLYGNVAEFVP